MDDSEATSLEQIRAFLEGSGGVRFDGQRRDEVYAWTERTLVRHRYAELSRKEKGLVRRYVARMTGLSRARSDAPDRRLCRHCGRVKAAPYQRRKFATRRYTKGDVELLAYVDKSHGNLSGPATKRILEREYSEYGQAAYLRLADISVAQIYRFRNSQAYRKRNTSYQPTRPTPILIGERRKPRPQGRPGYLRIDTVHQGDRDGVKGIYHINAVDEVTQWEIVAATPQISEYWLIPLLERLLGQFPFLIRGFHSDNGSEFINYTVARLLEKLLIEQTKSRAHRTGDNGLVESKNGSVVGKHMGFGHIAAPHAEAVDRFHRRYLNPCRLSPALCRSSGDHRAQRPDDAVFNASGPRPSRSSVRRLSARAVCGPVSAWPIWNASPKRSPIPKLPSKCKKQNADCWLGLPSAAPDRRAVLYSAEQEKRDLKRVLSLHPNPAQPR